MLDEDDHGFEEHMNWKKGKGKDKTKTSMKVQLSADVAAMSSHSDNRKYYPETTCESRTSSNN